MHTEVIGADRGLRRVMRQVRRAAATDANVVVRGETGSGKEVVARAVHVRSNRSRGPFVVANCAAVPFELMESEFFGHVRGAFTGAIADHVGYFEAAADGTLLLDEIGDLHPRLQAKILRVVEDRSFRRVGSAQVVLNRARLVAATNQPLEELIERHCFRSDLFYRLAVLTIEVPPLRRHLVDVPDLVRHFTVSAARRLGRVPPMIAPDAMARLCAYDWPGNVRELRSVIERLIVCDAEVIEGRHVDASLATKVRASADRPVLTLQEAERNAIARALEHYGGNRTRAAAALEIGRRTLQMKIREYGLDGDASAGESS